MRARRETDRETEKEITEKEILIDRERKIESSKEKERKGG